MNKEDFNNWLQKAEIDKDGKYTSLLSTECLYEFYKEARNEQLRLSGVSKSFTADEVADMLVNKFTTIEEAIHFFDIKSK